MLADRLWAIVKVRERTREEAGWGSKWDPRQGGAGDLVQGRAGRLRDVDGLSRLRCQASPQAGPTSLRLSPGPQSLSEYLSSVCQLLTCHLMCDFWLNHLERPIFQKRKLRHKGFGHS